MARKSAITKPARRKNTEMPSEWQQVLWRLDRLERQVQKLSELVRDHAEDEDRLVRIVAEDRDVLRRELLRKHQAKLRIRKRAYVGS
ncbi:MAG: hypothetical protein C4293_20885 [Nitrospiraceae bacterium]